MSKRKVLLIGWDAADWKVIRPLMDAGKMPNLQRLVQRGASGQISTLHPPLSPMLWTSIATGKRPFKHGIHGFSEPTPDGLGVRPVTNLSRTSKALWNILSQSDLRSTVIGWWPSHPAEPIHGVMVSDLFHRAHRPLDEGWPLISGAVHPPSLASTIASLRVHPDSLTPEMVEPFIPLARGIDQEKDKRLATLLRIIAECASVHAAALWLLEHEPWDFFAVYHDAIDHFCHAFMRYHPPRQSWIRDRDFAIYHHVISAAYQLHDRMLGELLNKAGEEATVLLMSDHGFHPDHLRPSAIPDVPAGPAIEHRDFGVLAIGGPGLKQQEPLYGASVLDIAPTILALYGLPVGEDMDGKVLTGAFVEPPPPSFIPSWENVSGEDGRHPPHRLFDPVAAREALEQMVALGYIQRPEEDREIAVRKTVRELRYNLAEAFQDAGRHSEAHAILSELHREDPPEQRFAVRLFASCQALGLPDEMRHIVQELEPSAQPGVVEYLRAQVLMAEARSAEALEILERIEHASFVRPGVLLQKAELYRKLRRPREARAVYQRALEIDPDYVAAHLGLAQLDLGRKDFAAAAASALDAIQRRHHHPQAHFLLGLALTGLKEYQRSADSFRAAISFNPNYPEAHLQLSALFDKHLKDPGAAREHRRLARLMRKGVHAVQVIPSGPERIEVGQPLAPSSSPMPSLDQCLMVVTGLPRSGTSMLMQMLAAGGMQILSDELRQPDEDNPRGYFEFDPVRSLSTSPTILSAARGKAIKIVAPLLGALPPGIPCRVILCERDLDEVLDSQERMLQRRDQPPSTHARREILKREYARTLSRVKAVLASRPCTRVLTLQHRDAIFDPSSTARKLNQFLEGGFDIDRMSISVDPALYRNRATTAIS